MKGRRVTKLPTLTDDPDSNTTWDPTWRHSPVSTFETRRRLPGDRGSKSVQLITSQSCKVLQKLKRSVEASTEPSNTIICNSDWTSCVRSPHLTGT